MKKIFGECLNCGGDIQFGDEYLLIPGGEFMCLDCVEEHTTVAVEPDDPRIDREYDAWKDEQLWLED